MDERLGRNVERLARWWTSAGEKARYEALRLAIHGQAPFEDFEALRLAIILAETEAGQVAEG